MTPLFTARRKQKRQGPSTPRDPSPPDSSNTNEDEDGPVVVRKPLSGIKNKSKLRTSQVSTPTIQTPKIQSTNVTPEPDSRPSDQPVSIPSAVVNIQYDSHVAPETSALQPQNLTIDIASKFGPSASTTPSGILNPTQIAERKARRARLAKESQAALLSSDNNNNSISKNSDFISLDAYDSDGEFKPSRMQISTYLRDDNVAASKEFTRLVPEDEDIAEGFESFVEADNSGGPNRLNMSMKINEAREREAIRTLIDRAEGHSIKDNDSDASHAHSEDDSEASSDSDASQTAAYTTAQTIHGTSLSHLSSAQRRQLTRDTVRPRAPEKATAIPSLAAGLARLRDLQGQAEAGKLRAEVRIGEIDKRLQEVEGEKERIQKGLEEVGRELEAVSVNGNGTDEMGKGSGRGLDDIGGVA